MNIETKIEPTFIIDDLVEHPKHYANKKIETLEWIESEAIAATAAGIDGDMVVFISHVQRYTARYHSKNGLQDLKKAQFYLNRAIEEYKH
jgi:hypothetical protein